ncbi:probable serine/threonine-protein kinase kinX isoform X3 [Folsomia candida]|uniref:probable serine/threonine-protein kinase kinX isoform X2 n=1 Tax=Folsomia candida TaxID=158441 RepID=UPI00160555E0|nr:probable serine/threonine-protein kinase kinX isoform X2 [Folsomia candida]XP_035705796.1 probable serine/threonine-protein kinase kinX isoform X3 [Folsomia candida]
MADYVGQVDDGWEIKNVNASQPEILGDLIMQKFVESKSQIYTFLLCGECLQIPPSNNYQYVCEQGHVMCESCGYKTAACAFVYSGNKCDRKISRVKITIAQQQLSNCFLSDDTPGKEICEVTIPSPSVVESEKLVLPDATTQQPNTDDVISKTVSTNEIVAVNPPIKLDEKLSDDIHAITNPAIVEAIGLPDNAPSTVMLKPISTEPATQMDTMEENSTCDFSPKSCSSSPKLETDMQKTIDMEKDEESPQKIEESPQELAPQKLEASESPQKLEASESPQKLEASESPQKLEASESPQKLEASESPQKLEASESPQKLEELPQKIEELPQQLEKLQKLEELPQKLEELPQKLEELPQKLEELPQKLEELPQKLEELPQKLEASESPQNVEESEFPQKVEESPQELAPQKLEELPQKLEASESPQNVEESEFPQKVDKSPQKLEASESPQKLEELPQQLKKLPQKLEESESSQKLGETFQVEQTQPLAAKFYHLKRLSKYFTKEELADVKEWMGRTCTNMTEAERTIVCRYRLHQILEEKTFADFFWDSIRK